MRKIICKAVYDTETATLINKKTHGNFGDADGYEESVYMTPEGKYFLYVNGGEASIHSEENITRLSKAKAEELLG